MSRTQPATNTEWGHYGERVVRARHGLDEIPDQDPRAWYADAEVTEGSTLPLEPGTLIEVKTCRRVVVYGNRHTPGRWWLEKEATLHNADENGLVAFVVYDPDLREPVLRTQLYRTEDVINTWIEGWTSNGHDHHKGEYSTRIRWTDVFQTLRDPLPEWRRE